MKKIVLLLIAAIGMVTIAQSQPVTFKIKKHNFGKIKKGVPVSYSFQFTNTSNNMVVIENATAECGCTTPEYPKTPIAKGATKSIKVTYNAEAMGAFTKKVTVKLANVAEPIYLNIEGEVVDTKGTAAARPKTKKA